MAEESGPEPPKAGKEPRAGGQAKAAEGKARRRQAETGRKRAAGRAGAAPVAGHAPGESTSSAEERIESHLARIEEALVSQSRQSDALLGKVEEMLREAREPEGQGVAEPDRRGD